MSSDTVSATPVDSDDLVLTHPFDYSQLPDALAFSLKDRAHRIRTTYENAIIEMGRELAEAQEELAHHGSGTFGAWAQAELGLSKSSVYNLINVYNGYKVRPNIWTNLNLSRSALYLLAQPSTPDDVVDEIAQRVQDGESVSHKDVQAAVGKAKGPTEFQVRVGKGIVATLKRLGPLSLSDLVKYAGYIEINVKAALRHLDQVTLQDAPDGAQVYWFAGTPFPVDDTVEPVPALPEDTSWINDIPPRQCEFLLAVAAGEPVVKNAATRIALVNRKLIQNHDPADGEWWSAIKLTQKGQRAAALLAAIQVEEYLETVEITEAADSSPLPAHGDGTSEGSPLESAPPAEGPGEATAPTLSETDRQFADDAALAGRIMQALDHGPKSLTELSKVLGTHPQKLMPVCQHLATSRPPILVRQVVPGSGGVARYTLARDVTPAPSLPVGINGAGRSDTYDPAVEGAIQVCMDLEAACVRLMGAIENFTRIKSVTSLAALETERLAGTADLLRRVVTGCETTKAHANGLLIALSILDSTPSDAATR